MGTIKIFQILTLHTQPTNLQHLYLDLNTLSEKHLFGQLIRFFLKKELPQIFIEFNGTALLSSRGHLMKHFKIVNYNVTFYAATFSR